MPNQAKTGYREVDGVTVYVHRTGDPEYSWCGEYEIGLNRKPLRSCARTYAKLMSIVKRDLREVRSVDNALYRDNPISTHQKVGIALLGCVAVGLIYLGWRNRHPGLVSVLPPVPVGYTWKKLTESNGSLLSISYTVPPNTRFRAAYSAGNSFPYNDFDNVAWYTVATVRPTGWPLDSTFEPIGINTQQWVEGMTGTQPLSLEGNLLHFGPMSMWTLVPGS